MALVLAGLALPALTGCGTGEGPNTGQAASAPPSPGTATGSPGPTTAAQPVVSMRVTGGLVGGMQDRSDPPMLAVYADGRAVLDGRRTLLLTDSQLSSLLAALRSDLGDQPATASPSGYAVADARTVSIIVRADDSGTAVRSVTATGLDAVPQAFPPDLVDAYDRLQALARRVTASGVPGTPAGPDPSGGGASASPR